MELFFSLGQIETVAKQLIEILEDQTVVAFHGNMGTGKTTLIHAVCIALGVTENISSPTFSIIHEYSDVNERIIYHIDLYRLKDEAEAIDAGVEDCVYSGNLCFIEWPEKISSLLPPGVLHVYLETVNDERRRLVYKVEP